MAEYQNCDAIAGLIFNMYDRTVMCWQGLKWIAYFMHGYRAPGEIKIFTGVQHLKLRTGNGQYRLQKTHTWGMYATVFGSSKTGLFTACHMSSLDRDVES